MQSFNGTLEKDPAGHTLKFERHLPHLVEEVWRAISEPALLKLWLANVDVDLKTGGNIQLQFINTGDVVSGTVLICHPNQLLEYSWKLRDDPESIVRWELKPEGRASCLLLLTHRMLGRNVPTIAAAWHIHLDLLSDVLEGKLGAFFWPDQKWIEEHDKYAQLLG